MTAPVPRDELRELAQSLIWHSPNTASQGRALLTLLAEADADRAEVERLRQEVAERLRAHEEDSQQDGAEQERLEAEVARWTAIVRACEGGHTNAGYHCVSCCARNIAAPRDRRIVAAEAEVERWRSVYAGTPESLQETAAILAVEAGRQRDERARLDADRAELAEVREHCDTYRTRAQTLAAEVARLSAIVGDQAVAMADSSERHFAEVARLREQSESWRLAAVEEQSRDEGPELERLRELEAACLAWWDGTHASPPNDEVTEALFACRHAHGARTFDEVQALSKRIRAARAARQGGE